MKVKAKVIGYYGNKRRKEGDVFDLSSEKHFSDRWMVKLAKGAKAPKQEEPEEEEEEVPGDSQSGDDDVI